MPDVHAQVQPATHTDTKEQDGCQTQEVESVDRSNQNPPLTREDDDDDPGGDDPELHARTWIALAAFFLLNFTQVVALQGPTAVVSLFISS